MNHFYQGTQAWWTIPEMAQRRPGEPYLTWNYTGQVSHILKVHRLVNHNLQGTAQARWQVSLTWSRWGGRRWGWWCTGPAGGSAGTWWPGTTPAHYWGPWRGSDSQNSGHRDHTPSPPPCVFTTQALLREEQQQGCVSLRWIQHKARTRLRGLPAPFVVHLVLDLPPGDCGGEGVTKPAGNRVARFSKGIKMISTTRSTRSLDSLICMWEMPTRQLTLKLCQLF